MNRKDFIARVGIGVAVALVPACLGGLAGCKKKTESPAKIDFTLDTSTGKLSKNDGFIVQEGVIVARTNSGTFIAVNASCTHEGTTINYNPSGNNFICPNHQAHFDSSGKVTQGPATKNLQSYNTSLTGTSLRVFS